MFYGKRTYKKRSPEKPEKQAKVRTYGIYKNPVVFTVGEGFSVLTDKKTDGVTACKICGAKTDGSVICDECKMLYRDKIKRGFVKALDDKNDTFEFTF